MNILLTRSLNLLEYDLKNSFISDKKNYKILSFTSKLMGFPESQKYLGNFFYCFSQIKANEFYIGKSIPLLRSNWVKAFLILIIENCINNKSDIKLHIYPEKKYDLGLLTMGWVKENLKEYNIKNYKKDLISISKRDLNTISRRSISTLEWAAKNFQELIHIDLCTNHLPKMNSFLLKTFSEKNNISNDTDMSLLKSSLGDLYKDSSYEEFFNDKNLDSLSGYIPWKDDSTKIDFYSEISRSIGTMSYYIAGMGYKAPQIANIIKIHCKSSKKMTISDYGGGYGLLLAELMLDDSLDISLCYLRDILPQNLIFFQTLFRYFNEKFKDSFKFSLGSVESLNTFKTSSVAIFIGSLLYVPRSERERVLDGVWESLEKGGILILHENIKHPSYTTDYEKMFTVDEIEQLLSKYGEIIRYNSNYFSRVKYEDLGERDTLFRVIIKN